MWKQPLEVLYLICFSIILTEGDGQKAFHFPTLKEQKQMDHQRNRAEMQLFRATCLEKCLLDSSSTEEVKLQPLFSIYTSVFQYN